MMTSPSDNNTPIIVGIDIGGTKIAVATAELSGKILAKARMATEADRGPDHTIPRMIELVHQLLHDSGTARPVAIGVGCGGPLDPDSGVVFSPPNLPGWDALPLKRLLENEFALPVYVDNDANAAALGEYMFGAGGDVNTMVYITVSTGIGGGIIANEQLLWGVRAGAGEIGHQTILPDGPACNCGNRGCLETLASGTAIARRAREALADCQDSLMLSLVDGDIARVTAETVVQAVRQDDPLARRVWRDTIEYLSIGVANVITTLAPNLIVIGGGVSQAGDLLFPPLRQAVSRRVFVVPVERVQITPSRLGDQVGIIGAVAVALRHWKGA